MQRLMIIPAAGSGTRLGADVPKLMVPVDGRPMLDHLLELYAPLIDHFYVVVSPRAQAMVNDHLAGLEYPVTVTVQDAPTGMLDAIMVPLPLLAARRPVQVWVTWCDQVAIRPQTAQRLAQAVAENPAALLVLPTMQREQPYIHLERDATGTIRRILHAREGDAMPALGESDMGLFVMSDSGCFDWLPRYASAVESGAGTGERNFLPFIAWAGQHGQVCTIPGTFPEECIGVNTPEELAQVTRWLRHE